MTHEDSLAAAEFLSLTLSELKSCKILTSRHTALQYCSSTALHLLYNQPPSQSSTLSQSRTTSGRRRRAAERLHASGHRINSQSTDGKIKATQQKILTIKFQLLQHHHISASSRVPRGLGCDQLQSSIKCFDCLWLSQLFCQFMQTMLLWK